MRKKKPLNTTRLIDTAVKKDLKWNPENVRCEELSDGNVNYLFRIINKETRESVVMKIADSVTRIKPDGYVSPKRNEFEAGMLGWFSLALKKLNMNVPRLKIPEVFSINKAKHYFLMEDIVPSITLRQALMEGVMPVNLGVSFATFIATSQIPFVKLVQRIGFDELLDFLTYNDDLIKITEDLVFTHPFFDKKGRNVYTKGNEEFLKKEINDDKHLRFVSAKLLNKFKTYKQALIHGDLHTGSVLVRFDGKKIVGKVSENIEFFVIDSEFATIAPIAYDLGNVIAHLTIVKIYHSLKSNITNKNRIDIHTYFSNEIDTFISLFKDLSYKTLRYGIENPLYKSDKFVNRYIEDIISDTWRFAGLEMIRRVVGSAKVPELTTTTNTETRIDMERVIVKVAKDFIFSDNKV